METDQRAPSTVKIFRGTFVHTTTSSPMEILPKKVLGVKGHKIVFFEDDNYWKEILDNPEYSQAQIWDLTDTQFMMPGFIDTHTHAPQYLNLGTSLDSGLIEWLEKYTFPTESKFSDLKIAERVYSAVVRRLLNNGTTTAAYFGTIHKEACLTLVDIIEREGQRAFVGKVNMDRNSPDYYIETTDASLNDTESFVKNVLQRQNRLVTPVITPRFALSCSEALLDGLADLAKKYDLPIQTHISECKHECQQVSERFPNRDHYTDVYDQAGLLTNRTILAHGVYLSDSELEVIKSRGCGISHCANSNASLRSGIMDARKILDGGIKLGLGTDMSGGFSSSMLDAFRSTMLVANLRSALISNSDKPLLKHEEVFHMATLGGAQVLGLEEIVGSFTPGKDFDALLIDCGIDGGPFDIDDDHIDIDTCIQKFLYQGDDRNIKQVFVSGEQVKPKM